MAKLEESYRKKYEAGATGGETNFVSPDDYQFGSYIRRLEIAMYGIWAPPPEAAKMGIEGITLLGVTFNRKGEVIRYELLESSGSSILDNEALRAIKLLGPVGPLPKGYPKDTVTFPWLFIYEGSRFTIRTLR
jgi:protein TonB